MFYMVRTYPFFGCTPAECAANQWFGLNPISAGMIGLPVGLITIVVVSLLTSPPPEKVQQLVDHVRYPHLRGDTVSTLGT
jgi:cation/acetate symporter